MKALASSKKISFFLMGLGVLLLILFSYTRAFDEFELSLLDARYRARPSRTASEKIAIIEIGDDTIEKFGKWPIDRKYHALMVRALHSAGAKKIIFDIFFSEQKVIAGDRQLAHRAEEAGNVYFPYVFYIDNKSRTSPVLKANAFAAPLLPELDRAAKGTGFVNIEADPDGKIRRFPPFIEYEGEYYPHITFNAALKSRGYEFSKLDIRPGRSMQVGDLTVPLDENSLVMVDYLGRWGESFRHYSYINVLQSYLSGPAGQEPVMDLSVFENAICFIAFTATASPDAHPSPLEKLYPGVGVHCAIYESVLTGTFPRRLGRTGNLVILFMLWALSFLIIEKSRNEWALLFTALLIATFVLAAFLCFWPGGVWIDLFYPVITVIGLYVFMSFKKYLGELKRREVIEKELSIAKEIQESFLPEALPSVGDTQTAVKMITAQQVGGDLYDVIEPVPGKLGVMLGDVSGKGVPAALYMARVVTMFKTIAKETLDTSGVLDTMNMRLLTEARSNLFVTLSYMIFDPEERVMRYSIGGHLPTMEVGPGGAVEFLDASEGLPLGMLEGSFSLEERPYRPGSMYVLYSDGVTEAMNTNGEMFGSARLRELGAELEGLSAEDAVEVVHRAVSDFASGAKQHDDVTVLVIRT